MRCKQLPWNKRHFQIKKFTHLHLTLGSTHFFLCNIIINLETQFFLKAHLFYKPEYIPTTAKALSMTLFPPPHFIDGRSCEETYIQRTNI